MLRRAQIYLPAIGSALLLAAANRWTVVGFLSCIALVPWLFAIHESDRRFAWRSGFWFGVFYFGAQFFWLAQFVIQWTNSITFGLFPWALATLLAANYGGLFGLLAERAFRTNAWWKIPLAWAAVELLRSYIPMLAFPWGLAANTLRTYLPVIQTAHLGSVYFVSAEIILANLVVLALWKRDLAPKKLVWAGPTALGVAIVASLVLFNRPIEGKKLKVMVVQTGVNMAFGDQMKMEVDTADRVNAALHEATKKKPDLLVMPEAAAGVVPTLPPRTGLDFDPEVPAVLGAQFGVRPTYQSALGWDGNWQIAHKTRLVIFGEFVPLRSVIPALAEAFKLPAGDLSSGPDGVKSMHLGKATVGPVLCFEGLFPDIAYRQLWNGADLLAVMSIDDWYLNSDAPEQLHAAAMWRSIETGLPAARAATLGQSDAFDSHGKATNPPIPLGKAANQVIEMTLPKPEKWPIYSASAFLLWAILVTIGLLFKPKEYVAKKKRTR